MGRPSVRHLIVDAGLRVFLRGGFNASSVQDITEEAGVPKGSFYNHFESKEALGTEIVDLYAEGGERRDALKDVSLPPLERLRRHFDGLSQMVAESGFEEGCLLGNFSAELADSSPAIRARLAAFLLDAYEGAILRARVEKSAAPFERFDTLAFGKILR